MLGIKGNMAGPAVLMIILCAAGFSSCNDDGKEYWRNGEDSLQEIMPALPESLDGFGSIPDYEVSMYLFNEMTSGCMMYQGANSFSGLKPFVTELAAYDLMAVMLGGGTANISYEASENATKNSVISVIDMNDDIPDIVVASASVRQRITGPVVLEDVRRLVGGLSIRLTEVPADVRSISVTVDDLYDQVSFTGDYGFASNVPASRTFELVKDGSAFSASSVMLPSDATLSELRLRFELVKDGETDEYTVTFEGGIIADKVAGLDAAAGDVLKKGSVGLSFTYKPWSSDKTIDDNFVIKDDLTKVWSSSELKLGGDSGADNFWASSSLVNEWAAQYDSYLYDGIMDADHKDEYWGPDLEQEPGAPCWYIDLGGSREGVTVTYWNKFGGAGGQKVRTMDIYGSNVRSDYDGGDTAWALISTFISDKTQPTVDAGAEVTTGRVEFDKGNTSYRYLKCVMTSRVSNNGDIIEDGDVNVAEVEVEVWDCK